MPGRPVSAIVLFSTGDQITVGQERRVTGFLSDQGGREHRHHVGAVQEIGDVAESLGLALGAEIPAGLIKPFQRSVVLGANAGHNIQFKFRWWIGQGQMVVIDLITVSGERRSVQRQGDQFQMLAIQHQGCSGQRRFSADDVQPGMNGGEIVAQLEPQVDGGNPVGGRRVVVEVDGLGRWGRHERFSMGELS